MLASALAKGDLVVDLLQPLLLEPLAKLPALVKILPRIAVDRSWQALALILLPLLVNLLLFPHIPLVFPRIRVERWRGISARRQRGVGMGVGRGPTLELRH